MKQKIRWLALGGLLTAALAVALAFAWTVWRTYRSPPMREVLRWLPENTECIAWMDEAITLPPSSNEQTEEFLSVLPFAPFIHYQGLDLGNVVNCRVDRSIVGMRNFGIDRMGNLQTFEGASVFLFEPGNIASADSLFHYLSNRTHTARESVGHPVIEISGENPERTLWVVRPRDTVIVLATNDGYLREVLLRINLHVAKSPMAVVAREGIAQSAGSRKWAYRVFDRGVATSDPGSPLHPRAAGGGALDPRAVSIFVSCHPANQRGLDVKYKSESPDASQRIQDNWRLFRSDRRPTVNGLPSGQIVLRFSESPELIDLNDSLLRYFGICGPE